MLTFIKKLHLKIDINLRLFFNIYINLFQTILISFKKNKIFKISYNFYKYNLKKKFIDILLLKNIEK